MKSLEEGGKRNFLVVVFRCLRRLCMAAGLLILVVTFTPVLRWAAHPLAPSWTNKNEGILIILSGSTVTLAGPPPNILIGNNTYWRVVHAIAVWRAGHFRKILVSGLGTSETVRPLLVANGIPEEAIVVENKATSTHENATFSRPILAGLEGPYVLLTSDYHMYRAAHCFARENIQVETMPAPDFYKRYYSYVARWNLFWELVNEYLAIGYYRVHGWI